MIANTPPTSTEHPETTPQTSPLDKYKFLALESLADIVRNTESSDRDRRLASVAILKYITAVETRPPAAAGEPSAARTSRFDTPPQTPEEAVARHEALHVISEEALTIAYERGYDDARQCLPAVPIDAVQVASESYFRMRHNAEDP